MRAAILGITAISALALAGPAMAQTTVITEPPAGTIVTSPAPGVIVERTAPGADVTGAVSPTNPGCAATVTKQDNPDGSSTTVRQERCNELRN